MILTSVLCIFGPCRVKLRLRQLYPSTKCVKRMRKGEKVGRKREGNIKQMEKVIVIEMKTHWQKIRAVPI